MLLSYGDVMLEVFVDPNHLSRRTNPEVLGFRHFCLAVESLEEAMSGV